VWVKITGDEDSATRAGFDTGSTRIELGDGLFMYEDTRITVRHWEHDIDIRVGVIDGRLAAEEVCVRCHDASTAVTSEALRAIPVAGLVRHAADAVQYVAGRHDGGAESIGPAWPNEEEGAYVAAHGLDDRTLKIVARVYRIAYLLGDSPTKKVETVFDIPRSTAGRWVSAARGRKYLSESRGAGKAG